MHNNDESVVGLEIDHWDYGKLDPESVVYKICQHDIFFLRRSSDNDNNYDSVAAALAIIKSDSNVVINTYKYNSRRMDKKMGCFLYRHPIELHNGSQCMDIDREMKIIDKLTKQAISTNNQQFKKVLSLQKKEPKIAANFAIAMIEKRTSRKVASCGFTRAYSQFKCKSAFFNTMSTLGLNRHLSKMTPNVNLHGFDTPVLTISTQSHILPPHAISGKMCSVNKLLKGKRLVVSFPGFKSPQIEQCLNELGNNYRSYNSDKQKFEENRINCSYWMYHKDIVPSVSMIAERVGLKPNFKWQSAGDVMVSRGDVYYFFFELDAINISIQSNVSIPRPDFSRLTVDSVESFNPLQACLKCKTSVLFSMHTEGMILPAISKLLKDEKKPEYECMSFGNHVEPYEDLDVNKMKQEVANLSSLLNNMSFKKTVSTNGDDVEDADEDEDDDVKLQCVDVARNNQANKPQIESSFPHIDDVCNSMMNEIENIWDSFNG